jgi:hypothetical protein
VITSKHSQSSWLPVGGKVSRTQCTVQVRPTYGMSGVPVLVNSVCEPEDGHVIEGWHR